MLTSTLNKYEIASAGAGPSFNYPYPIHKATDLTVYVDGALKATSDSTYPHTVTIAVNKQSATVNFTATSTTAVSGKTIIFERVVDYKQETDLANNSLLDAESLETSLDNIVMQTQQAGLKAAGAIGFDPGIDEDEFHTSVVDATTITLNKNSRKLKALCFDANGDITVSTDDIDAQIQTVANSATAAAASETAAGNSATASATTAAEAAAELAAFQVLYRGSSTSTPSNPGDGHLWFDTNTNVDVMKVYNATASAWEQLTPNSTHQTNINTVVANTLKTNIGTVAGIDANVTTVAGISGDVTTVAGIQANVTAVKNDAADIGSCAANSSNIQALGPIAANIATVAGISSNVTAVAGDAADIGAVAGKATEIGLLGTNDMANSTDGHLKVLGTSTMTGHITTVAGLDTEIAALGPISSNITTVATAPIPANMVTVSANAANITTVAGISANVTTVAGIASNVTAVAGDASDIGTVAASIADVNRYANEYKIATSAPGSPSEGDLWFDSSSNKVLKVYDGTSWETVTDGQTEAEVTTEATAQAISMAIALG